MALAGADPVEMLSGPIPASKSVLEKAGLTIENMVWWSIAGFFFFFFFSSFSFFVIYVLRFIYRSISFLTCRICTK
jgi:hypothetical protein